jgi:hypothetical protein
MSDTPISDSTPHNVADLGMRIRMIERELNAANAIIRQQQLLDEANLRLQNRIKRLEEDLMDAKNKHAALVADVALYEDRGERIKRLEREIEVLRFYGNKGCTAVADKILARNAKI